MDNKKALSEICRISAYTIASLGVLGNLIWLRDIGIFALLTGLVFVFILFLVLYSFSVILESLDSMSKKIDAQLSSQRALMKPEGASNGKPDLQSSK